MSTPQIMPILSAGSHKSPKEGACIMEMVSYLAGEEWSDSPACTHPVLASLARTVNDRLPDSERHLILPLVTRLMGTAGGGHSHSVLLAAWCAEQVVNLSSDPAAGRVAIEAARVWANEPNEVNRALAYEAAVAADAATAADASVAASYAAYAAYDAAYAAYDAAYAPVAHAAVAHAAATDAAFAAYAAAASWGDLIALLEGAISEHERLTNTTPAPLSDDDTARLAALTN